MKAHELISSIDDARYGHQNEDTNDVAKSPDHAPKSTAQWKTASSGKSEDEGEKTGGEKDAIKKSNHSLPAPIAKAPSHAPTSTAQWKTKNQGGSEDEGEKVSKEAMKEDLDLIAELADANDAEDVRAVLASIGLAEGGHKAGCTCGFCKNKGSFGKKKDEKKDGDEEEPMGESRHIGGGGGRMAFRHSRPRPKALQAPGQAPYQPSMERQNITRNPNKTIQEMADELLEAPE